MLTERLGLTLDPLEDASRKHDLSAPAYPETRLSCGTRGQVSGHAFDEVGEGRGLSRGCRSPTCGCIAGGVRLRERRGDRGGRPRVSRRPVSAERGASIEWPASIWVLSRARWLRWRGCSLPGSRNPKEACLPDTTAEVKAILARALRELEQVIDNARVKSLLRDLRNMLGVEDRAATAVTKPVSRRASRAKPEPAARRRASSARVAPVPQAKSAQATPRARTPAKPRAASTAPASSGAPAARRGGRREQLLALVVDQPGVTVAQAGKQFGIKDATGLYRVARRLQDEGLVRKRGAELHPTAKAQQR